MNAMPRTAAQALDNGPKIVRREQSARSLQHRGVLTQVIYECDGLEVLRTEMEAGSAIDSLEFGDWSAVHFVIDGTPAVRASNRSADLMPGDSIVFGDDGPYTILNGTPSRSIMLSILFRKCTTDARD